MTVHVWYIYQLIFMVNVDKYIAYMDAMGYDTNPNNALYFRIIHPYMCIKFEDSPPK